MSKSESSRPGAAPAPARLAARGLLGSAAAAFGQAPLVGNSPFMPSGGGGGGGAAAGEAYELAGSSVQGSDVSVCIYERQAKHSQWIPVGGIADGIHVISYDAVSDRAVVTIAGAFKELAMRKATVAAAEPVRRPRGRGVRPPSRRARRPGRVRAARVARHRSVQEQREARMLVSDLLEIGVQQRKAYQEAKQKAAREAPAQPSN